MTEIRDTGIPQDSRGKRAEMQDQDPLLLLFMRVIDTYDRNTCLKESKRLALSTLDDMCLQRASYVAIFLGKKTCQPTVNRFSLFDKQIFGKPGREIRYWLKTRYGDGQEKEEVD